APERLPGEPPLLRWVLQEVEPREVRSLTYLVEAQPQEATPYLEWPIRQANVFTESNQTGPGLAIRQIRAPDFTAGRPGTIEANLTQQGEAPLPIEVRVEAPGGWTIAPPTQNATLPPRGHLRLEFQATPPILAAGSDVATLRVLYEGGQVERKFTLFAGPDPVPLGAALGAVGLLALVLYLRQRLRQTRKKDTLNLLREMRRRIR
ncbi:MAG: hypothetical protein HY558_03800, partial [Euryarchaeota archaeon]|nr:hypothetical protein [Euryarchaeota archaeon]